MSSLIALTFALQEAGNCNDNDTLVPVNSIANYCRCGVLYNVLYSVQCTVHTSIVHHSADRPLVPAF